MGFTMLKLKDDMKKIERKEKDKKKTRNHIDGIKIEHNWKQ